MPSYSDITQAAGKTMLLCRVADSLFWMSRYIERAENTARLVDVNLQRLLESDGSSKAAARHWEGILMAMGDLALFRSLYPEVTSENAMEFFTFNRDNPSSIISCIYAARENARMIRDQIAEEMWVVINRIYLFLKDQNAKSVWETGTSDFFEHVKELTLLFQGTTDAIFPHNVGFEFIKCGAYIERADKIARLVDIKYYLLLPSEQDVGGAVDAAGWVTVLRACSGREAYQHTFVQDISVRNVADLLIMSRVFPRSVSYSVQCLQQAMHAISGCPITHFSNDAERLTGRLVSDLSYTSVDDIMKKGLHETIGELTERIDAIAIELSRRYMFFPIVDPAAQLEKSGSAAA